MHLKTTISKVIALTLLVATLLSPGLMKVSAQSRITAYSAAQTIQLSSGGYIVIETMEDTSVHRSSIRSFHKTAKNYNSKGELACSMTLWADFNGTTCVKATISSEVYIKSWSVEKQTVSHSGNTARATADMVKRLLGIAVHRDSIVLTLTMDSNGNIK